MARDSRNEEQKPLPRTSTGELVRLSVEPPRVPEPESVLDVTPAPRHAPWFVRYAVALEALLAAGFIQLLLYRIDGQSRFMMFCGGILVSAWFGGRGPGLLTTALSTLLIGRFFYGIGDLVTLTPVVLTDLTVFVLSGAMLMFAGSQLRTAQQRAATAEARLGALERRHEAMLALLSERILPRLDTTSRSLRSGAASRTPDALTEADQQLSHVVTTLDGLVRGRGGSPRRAEDEAAVAIRATAS